MRVLVLGAAVSGKAAGRLLAALGHTVVVYDDDPAAAGGVAEAAESHGGSWDPSLLDGVELVVASPGVPEHARPIRDSLAAGRPVWSEIELGARHVGVPIAAVTGTNGKTTVTALTAAMLRASGLRAAAVGNIGDPLCDAVGGGWDVLAVEVSSLQLRFTEAFHPRSAVLLNVAPDHLDWHRTFEAYLAAKARIWERQTAGEVLAYDADDPGAVAAVAGAPSRLVPVSGTLRPPGGCGPEGGVLEAGGARIPIADLARDDAVYLVDVAAAAVAAAGVGATPAGIVEAAASFRPAPHRRERIAVVDGVAYVDDSKATNPHAALAAIRAFPSVVLIAGGRNKDLDVTVLADERNVRFVVGIGETGPEIVERAPAGRMASGMEEAVAIARSVARHGDTVLLAPGCASFDMYGSYGERGDHFAALVRDLEGAR
jgi:UDP-N-acetylmuramoylalanine--D-glutamate ligase